ncbi:MAG: 16S rRNA (adenine(1518)-N(6)/adenine(1519)-N(6))-dimethyltransferase RsmA [Alphaproteobacteria bacterium]|nr:16S rRNA (adenine(1518)-N(6)/adenine(1519)-N(6))-dimethyltransferase RsmA [Alphaproteobacteria bacterium]
MKENEKSVLPPLRDVIAKHGLAAKKSLGQNFLLDSNLTDRIAREAAAIAAEKGKPFSESIVLEVGSGPGGLTRSILSATDAKKVISIERDNRCIAAMHELEDYYKSGDEKRFSVVEGDALKSTVAEFFNQYASDVFAKNISVVANLPYNISTVLLTGWLKEIYEGKVSLGCLVLMFQKEVVSRIVAKHGNSAYGRLSILAQWLCETKSLFDVNPKAFTPPPKVTSTVAAFVPREKPLFDAKFSVLEKVTAAAFGQRRKMLRSSLKALGVNAEEICEYSGVASTQRAEEISIESYCAMARFVENQRN